MNTLPPHPQPIPTTGDGTEISSSPDRHTFQKRGYVKRQAEKNEPINEEYLDLFQTMLDQHKHRFDTPESCKNSLEYDLLTTAWILEKVRASDEYSQHLYAALCNNEFQRQEVWVVLKDQRWSCSWRYAGGIIADMRQEGDYLDWYCSGIASSDEPNVNDQESTDPRKRYVSESIVTDEIAADLAALGWRVCDDTDQL